MIRSVHRTETCLGEASSKYPCALYASAHGHVIISRAGDAIGRLPSRDAQLTSSLPPPSDVVEASAKEGGPCDSSRSNVRPIGLQS